VTTYGLLIFDGAEELDFVGPWEVFTASSMLRGNAATAVMLAEHTDPGSVGRTDVRAVRRYIQYDPAPPYLADEPVVP
jgi:putative intracellular protease/amidase